MNGMVTSTNVDIYTDGSAIRNPGPSGAAYVMQWYESDPNTNSLPVPKQLMGSTGYRLSTNSRMEIMGVINGLTAFYEKVANSEFAGVGQCTIKSDSEYVCNAINLGWLDRWQKNNWMTAAFQGRASKPVSNRDLWDMLLILMDQIRNNGINITFTHVKGHNGDPLNEKADELAQAAASDAATQKIDEEYEKSHVRR